MTAGPSDGSAGTIGVSVSMPAAVPEGFVRTTTLMVRGRRAWTPGSRDATPDQKMAIAEAAGIADRRMLARLDAWISAAVKAMTETPEDFSGRTTTGSGWSVFVNTIEISRRGRVVMTVPNLHGWPMAGPMDPTPRTLDDDQIGMVLSATAALPRVDDEATFKKDVEKAGTLLGACLRTLDGELHDMMRTDQDRCWMLVSLEQEDGLTTCVLDGTDAVDAEEAMAWHPPATASDAVPVRLVCSRSGSGWLVDGIDWREKVECVLPTPTDPMETLRLCTPHVPR
jgi:hypothetical protein